MNENEVHISYEVMSRQIEFFKIGDRVLTRLELEGTRINLEKDYILVKTVFGKQAVDECKSLNCAAGISIYKLKR